MGGPKRSCTDTKDGTGCDNKDARTTVDDNSTVKLRLEEFSKEYRTGTKHIQRIPVII